MMPIPQMLAARKTPGNGAVSDRLQLIVRSAPTRQMPPPRANLVLAAVPSAGLQHILAHVESVNMTAGDVLYEAGCKPRYIHFPTTAIVSLVCETADGSPSEICAVGNDGVVGIELFTGGDTAANRAVVTTPGHGYRLAARHLKCDLAGTAMLMPALLRYTQALITQIAQIAVCNRHHSVEQQLCRRLLYSLDHLPPGDLRMSHSLIADMLGVRRESITMVAGKLQSAGMIKYFRGRIKILDRSGLELRACECYTGVKQTSAQSVMSVGQRDTRVAA